MNDPVKEPNFVKLFISSECSYCISFKDWLPSSTAQHM